MSSDFDEKMLFDACKYMRNDQMVISDYIEQLSGLLFLKACQESPRINQDDLNLPETARWERLVSDDTRRNQSVTETYDDMIHELQTDGKLAREAFNGFTNKFGSETTLKNTIDAIETLEFWDRYDGYADFFGDAYEFLLEKYADKADGAGEYFTPRPLIRAMVEIADPEYTETVYDPASGTNGFLIEAYNHVGEKTSGETAGGNRRFLNIPDDGPDSFEKNITGRELTHQTYRLGLMNLLLHDIDPTEMTSSRGNSLTKEVDQEYDLVLANPPYGGGGSTKFVGAWADSSAPETNFIQLIMRSLSKDGRAAIIVPDGILFRSGAEQSVRERLLDQYHLDCILVLPENSFHPYAGVDANVLFFERDATGTDEVWYYDMRSDVEGIKEANPLTDTHFENFVSDYHDPEARENSEMFFKVPTEEIIENDYDLNYKEYREYASNQYRPLTTITQDIRDELEVLDGSSKFTISTKKESNEDILIGFPTEDELPEGWKMKKIGDIVEKAMNGGTPKRSNSEFWGGDIEWLSSGEVRGKYVDQTNEKITQTALDDSSAKIFPKDSVLVALYGSGTRGQSAITDRELSGNQAICCLVPDSDEVSTEYLLYFFKSIKEQLAAKGRGGAQKNLNQSMILDEQIPVPPLSQQKDIVNQIEDTQEQIESAKTTIETLDNQLDEYHESVLAHAIRGELVDSGDVESQKRNIKNTGND